MATSEDEKISPGAAFGVGMLMLFVGLALGALVGGCLVYHSTRENIHIEKVLNRGTDAWREDGGESQITRRWIDVELNRQTKVRVSLSEEAYKKLGGR